MADRILHRLLEDLKRRKVIRVAVVYVVVAWGTIEVAETIFPILGLPDVLLKAVVVLAMLGLPLVLVMTWALEVTPEGVRVTGSDPAGASDDLAKPAMAGLAVVALAAAVGGYLYLSDGSPEAVPVDRSIAVLPFENMSGDEENEYFSDGVTEDLLTNLSTIGDLRVISRTSVMTYKDSDKTIPQIARELGVAYILEGSVRKAGDQVRITAQLIRAATDDHLWAESYDRRLTDIFATQSEIARAIARELQAELSDAVRATLNDVPTQDMGAYEAYLKGRALLDRRSEAAVRGAVDQFQQALDRDPGYGLAWAGLADALGVMLYYDYPVPDSLPTAMEAATRAVQLDPELGQTHASVGIANSIERNGPEALAALRRAIELSPSYAEAYAWLAWSHLMVGNPEVALRPAHEAVELDPLAPAYHVFLAEALLANGRAADALEVARRASRIQPEYGLAHYMEALVLHHVGDTRAAAAAAARARDLVPPRGTPSHAELDGLVALGSLADRDTAVARATLERLSGAEGDADATFARGLILAALGDIDAAFQAFETVSAWDSFSNEQLRYFYPETLERLRADPRYDLLVRRVDRGWGVGPEGGPEEEPAPR